MTLSMVNKKGSMKEDQQIKYQKKKFFIKIGKNINESMVRIKALLHISYTALQLLGINN